MNPKGRTYKDAGVDIDAGSRAVELIKSSVRRTMRREVITEIGGFGGLFSLDTAKYRQPVLVSGTDGVGTKLKLAIEMDSHRTIGIDAVAMCVNDILVQGAEPLFFLDYLALGKLVPEKVAEIVEGVAEGCNMAGCALVGGETAEMPGMYQQDDYDIAGFAVGVVDREQIIDGSRIRPGDVLLGLKSSGVHSNGFSLVRRVLLQDAGLDLHGYHADFGSTLGEELLTPTRIYVSLVLPLIRQFDIKGIAHITGGGLLENIPRILPQGSAVELYRSTWRRPPIFDLIQKTGRIALEEMDRTFNQGIGMVLVVSEEETVAVQKQLKQQGEEAAVIGRVVVGRRQVSIK